MLAQLEQLSNEVIIASEEAGAVGGHVRGLGQRMHSDQAGVIAIGHARIEDRDRRVIVVPTQAHIALIGGDNGAGLPRPRHDAAQFLHADNAAGGIGRRIQKDQGGILEIGIRAQRRGAGEQGAYLVGGIGHRREGDGLAAHTQKRRQPGDSLLGANHRQYAVDLHVIAAR